MKEGDMEIEEAKARGRSLYAKRETTFQELRRLERETPDEARSEEG
jgi:hypothetical protein